MTAGRWPWKPASAKKCVTAYQPNGVDLKMDVAIPGEKRANTGLDDRMIFK